MRHDCNQAMNAEKPMIVDDLRRHAEWLKVAGHCLIRSAYVAPQASYGFGKHTLNESRSRTSDAS